MGRDYISFLRMKIFLRLTSDTAAFAQMQDMKEKMRKSMPAVVIMFPMPTIGGTMPPKT